MAGNNAPVSFPAYMRAGEQRLSLIVFLCLSLVIWALMKVWYPMPFLFPDSGSYVHSAVDGMLNVYRPMGYSNYIAFIHDLSPRIGTLFNVTFLLSTLAILWLLYSVKYLWGLRSDWMFYLLGVASIAAPRIIFASNFIMSDSLFHSLTLMFITSLLWIMRRRSVVMIVLNVLLLAALYKVRYVGMFYVVFSVLAIVFSARRPGWFGWVWAIIPILVLMRLDHTTADNYEKVTGSRKQGFAGWQLLNNASMLVPKGKNISAKELSQDERVMRSFFAQYPDSLFSTKMALTTDLMWNKSLPYRQLYFYSLNTSPRQPALAWVYMGNLYGDYATKLIKKYPWDYFTGFVLPSFMSNFDRRDIFESVDFKSEPLYSNYFTGVLEEYHAPFNVFGSLNGVRYVLGWVMWAALLASAVWFFARTRRWMLSDSRWRMAFGMILFVVAYLGLLCLASPNTTWRYTLPIYIPSLLFIVYNLRDALSALSERCAASKK